MHVRTKQLSFLGILLAVSSILLLLTTVLPFNTLFILALSSFLLGAAIKETNIRLGFSYLVAALILAFVLMPDKLLCITYGAFLGYIYLVECIKKKRKPLYKGSFYLVKFLFFNLCIMLPALIWFPNLIFQKNINWNPLVYGSVFVGGQVLLYLFDRAYERFIEYYWRELRNRIKW